MGDSEQTSEGLAAAPEAEVAAAAEAPQAEETAAAEMPAVMVARRTVPWWPFLVYLGVWVVLVALAAWFFMQTPKGIPLFDNDLYVFSLLGGAILTTAGPTLVLAVWFAAWLAAGSGNRTGLLTSALLKGAAATFGGVAIWWVMLLVVDTLRLGRPV